MQGVGKAYNELKQGEPALERLFELMRFKSKVHLSVILGFFFFFFSLLIFILILRITLYELLRKNFQKGENEIIVK